MPILHMAQPPTLRAMAALALEDRVPSSLAEEEGRSVRHCSHQSLSHASQTWKCWGWSHGSTMPGVASQVIHSLSRVLGEGTLSVEFMN